MASFLSDSIVLSALLSFILAQLCKICVASFKKKRFHPKVFFSLGGMPSVHTALVTGLATAVYVREGLSSIFVVALCFAIIVIYDSNSVRGRIKIGKDEDRIAHSIPEITVGAIIGILTAVLVGVL